MLNVLNIIHLLLHIFPWSSSSDEKGKGRINLLFRDIVAQSFYSCSFSSCFIVFPFVLLARSQAQHFFLFKNIYLLFLNFWLHWIFVAVHRLSLVAENGGFSYCNVRALERSFSNYGAQAQVPHSMWNLSGPGIYVSCIGKWILNHWTIKEVQAHISCKSYSRHYEKIIRADELDPGGL